MIMRKIVFTLLVMASAGLVSAQTLPSAEEISKAADEYKPKLGLKAGYNWSYITGSSQGFKKENNSGFMIGAFYAPASKGLGYRTEVIFSRQGYSFDNGGQNTDVQNDYIYLPQLTTFTIAKRLQLQAGAQVGYLLKARTSAGSKDSTITGLMNRFDYGFAGGVEVYPFKGLLIGARYNLGLGKLYKQQYKSTSPYPLPFNPETTDFKNGLVQFFAGYRF
jgi:hypothetical protein